MKITITLKSAYGRTLAYPADKAAQTFADMLKSKTLTRDNLNHIAAHDAKIEKRRKDRIAAANRRKNRGLELFIARLGENK